MSETQYFRNMLLTIQEKIRGLGATNRNRWAAFCYNKTMSIEEFVDKMVKYNLTYKAEDIKVIWESVGITAPVMDLSEFLKLMQFDVDTFQPLRGSRGAPQQQRRDMFEDATPSFGGRQQPAYGQPPQEQRGGAVDIIHHNLRNIIIGCMSRDSLMTGEISTSGFADVCSMYGVSESMPGFSRLMSVGDATNSGLVEYFTIAAHVCVVSNSAAPASSYNDPYSQRSRGGGYDAPAFDETPARSNQRKTAYESSISFGDAPAPSGSQRKTAYESSISFGDDEPRQAPRMQSGGGSSGGSGGGFYGGSGGGFSGGSGGGFSGGSGGGFDEFANMDKGNGSVNEVLKGISTRVTDTFGNSKNAFQKWRGMKERVGSEELRQGLIRDCKYVVPIETLQSICSRYGEPMNLTGFVKMMGDGSQINDQAMKRGNYQGSSERTAYKMTEDDQTIDDIAQQLRGTDWENMALKANNADDICRVFAKFGAQFDENRVRKLVAKQGRNGFLDSIADHIGN